MFFDNVFIDDSIERYVALYERGTDIKHIKPLLNESYKIFVGSNTSIRVISIKDNYELLTRNKKVHYFINQIRKEDIYRSKKYNINITDSYFYMIPIQTVNGTIIDFILRSVFGKKEYSRPVDINVGNIKKVPYMYGWYEDFKDYDSHNKCKPIVVCEGIKDSIYLKRFYPYILSNNTSHLGFNAHILRNITDKIILVYDNDEAGVKSRYSDKILLDKLRFNQYIITLDNGIKDPATYLDHPELEIKFRNKLLNAIYKLDNF